ncbi:MAG: aminotransferase class V-fold PLP-dependent enzyme [Spirochaetia bacterium]|nr:aminotransferase class V-fold PLP-dependent enzyme [Spirochaetia bacterium]
MLYFDYNSTHPPLTDVINGQMERYFANWANPSGISYISQKNQSWVEESRRQTATVLGCSPDELHFVSTGTEALYQMVRTFSEKGQTVVLSPFEHAAFYAACEDHGLHIVLIDADPSGIITPDTALAAVKRAENEAGAAPAFVSVIAVNNETGVIQDTAALAAAAHGAGIPFLSDTIQAAGKMSFDGTALDGMALNGHKIGAGPGAAALVIRGRRPVPLFHGGLQEDEKRAGTENTPALGALAAAAVWQSERFVEKEKRLRGFQTQLEEFLEKECGATIVAKKSPRAANTTFAVFSEMSNMDFVLMGLDRVNIALSTGSSCKSRTRQPSQVLLRMGFGREDAMRALRISTGSFTTADEVALFIEEFRKVYQRAL